MFLYDKKFNGATLKQEEYKMTIGISNGNT